ncbi:MAG TPA: Hsp20/alpha crystallin family protein, partial [bacterium]|nr:Hsp20/alpha crystallin family protein [bacterium]
LELKGDVIKKDKEKKDKDKDKKDKDKDKKDKDKEKKDKKKEKFREIKGPYLRREFKSQSFYRAFILPEDILSEDIDASFRNGVLRLNILKTSAIAKQKHVIDIK